MSDELDRPTEEQALSFDDIELAYREALKSIEDAEFQVGTALQEFAETNDNHDTGDEAAFVSIGEELAEDLAAAADSEAVAETRTDRVSPKAVVEAALFVGGDVALTARRLASLIGQDTDTRVAVRLIDQLNENYSAENRPYEIRLHEGGFKLELREEFANVQLKVFGLGPREVRLSPEALEVLAFIAYNQPVSKKTLSEISQHNAATIVRQLIRLRLVELDRESGKRAEVSYRAGDRFLKLFGLDDFADLPHADIFRFR